MTLLADTINEIIDLYEMQIIGHATENDHDKYGSFEQFYKAELLTDSIVKAWGLYEALTRWSIIEPGGNEDRKFKWMPFTTYGTDAEADARTVHEVDLLLNQKRFNLDNDDIDILRI